MLLELREKKKVEEKTIDKYIENDALNIEKVINEYSGYIYIIVKNLAKETISKEDIEEIISDVFVTFWNNREKLDKTKPIKSYLAGITKNLIKLKYRKIQFDFNIDDYENRLITNLSIVENFEIREGNNIVEKTLENMKKEDKDIFIMYYYNSKKIKEISKTLNISESKVKTKLHRIRKKLRKELEKNGYKLEN